MSNREHFNSKWGMKIQKDELDRKWRMHLREQEEADKIQSITSGAASLLVGGGAGGGYIPPSNPTGPEYYIRMYFDGAYPVANQYSLEDWNALFDLPDGGTPFTSLVVDETNPAELIVFLYSYVTGSVILKDSIFLNSTLITDFKDSGILDSVSSESFLNCTSIMNFASTSTSQIFDRAFEGATNLVDLNVESCVYIAPLAFKGCTSLTSIQLPSITIIESNVFDGCISLAEFYSDTLETLGSGAFVGCTDLVSVSISKTTYIGNEAFKDCTSLMGVNASQLTSLGSTIGDDGVFAGIDGPARMTTVFDLVVPAGLGTISGGSPDGDIDWLTTHFDPGFFEPSITYIV